MSSEESREQAEADSARSNREVPVGGEKKKKTKRPKPPLPRTEREIDAPDRVTLVMLGVLCFMTIVLWIFARSACNYHPPRETRRPRAVKTEDLARDPKDAALEMQQRLVQLNFDGALELAADSAEATVKKQKADCAGKVAECADKKKKYERTSTTAALLERDMASATVRATSVTPQAGKPLSNILVLERRGPAWKVVSFKVDDGTYQPKTPVEPAPMPTPMAPPSASGAVLKLGTSASVKLPTRPAPPPPAPPPAAPASAKP